MSELSASENNIRKLSWPEIGQLIKETFTEFFQEQSFFHGAALAYYTVFAVVPIIYLSLISFGRFVGQNTMLTIIDKLLHEQVGLEDTSAIMDVMQNVNFEKGSVVMNIVGIIALLLSSSALLASLRTSLNAFLDVEVVFDNRKKQFLHTLGSRGMTVIFLPVFGLLLILTYFGQTILLSFGQDFFGDLNAVESVILWLAQHVAAILANVLLFALVFKYLHDGTVEWKLAFAGATVTAILLYIGQLLIKYYLKNYFFGSSIGVPGTILVLLAWMYYSSQIIFLGAKFTKVYAVKVGHPIAFTPAKFHPKHMINRFRKPNIPKGPVN